MPVEGTVDDGESARLTHVTRTIAIHDRETCESCHSPILPGDTFCAACGARYGEEQPVQASSYDSHIPTQLVEASSGKYEIVKELGRGGMGFVYLARDLELDRLDAIKVLKPSMLAEEGMVERFRNEARTIAKLRHPSIVTVYGVGTAGNLHYFIMDYIDGTSLNRVLKNVGRLSIPVVEAILYQVGSALSFAHGTVIHRDVKPANIMLTREGRSVVTDFGIAKVTEAQAGLTRTGVLMGTPEYMSPEQCREASVSHHSDQYALGAVAFAMLTGAPPFTGQWLQVAAAHQTQPVPNVKDFRPECPDGLAETIERMLAKNPGDRWPDIKDALKNLDLRPLAHDDSAIIEISGLVGSTMELDEIKSSVGGATIPPVASRTPTDLRITAPPDEVEMGDRIVLHASMIFDDGGQEYTEGLTWESTDPTIASISADSGELHAMNVGTVEIRAKHQDMSGSLSIGVVPPRVVELAIAPAGVRIAPGDSVQLKAEPRNKRGETIERPVTWSTSNPRIARISDTGVLTARQPGTANVLAMCEGAGGAAMITVLGEGVHSDTPAAIPTDPELRALQSAATVVADPQALPPEPTPTPAPAPPREPAQPTPPPRTPEPEPALVTGDRTPAPRPRPSPKQTKKRSPVLLAVPLLIVAAGAGFWFTIGPGGSGAATAAAVRVTNAATGEAVGGSALTVDVGTPLRLNADVLDQSGAALERDPVWGSSNVTVAAVDQAGTVTPLQAGSAEITATFLDVAQSVSVTVTGQLDLRVTDAAGRPVSSLALVLGDEATFQPEVTGGDGMATVTWSSDDPDVVAVDGDGRITASGVGTASVTAQVGDVLRAIAVTVSDTAVVVAGGGGTPAGGGGTPPPARSYPMNVQIVITGAPFANVYINGALVGSEANSYPIRLDRGPNTLRFVHPAFPVHEVVIDPDTIPIVAGQPPEPIRIHLSR